MPTFGQAATGHHNCLGWEEVPLTSSGAASWGSCSRLGVGGGGGQDQGRWEWAPSRTRPHESICGIWSDCPMSAGHPALLCHLPGEGACPQEAGVCALLSSCGPAVTTGPGLGATPSSV